jgi:DNA-binding LacI/PurR family transcriptional regulator
VDQSTVSRVLRNDRQAKATEVTREKIRAAAGRLGYVPNATARSLAMKRTMTMGLLIPNSFSLTIPSVTRGADDAARSLGYILMVADASELGRASDAVRALVLEGRVDGLLIASGTTTDEVQDDLLYGSQNVVTLNRRIGRRAPSVIADDELGMYLCTKELIDAGHRDIACIAGPKGIDTSNRRLRGFRRALREVGLRLDQKAIAHAPFDEAGGYAGMSELLASGKHRTAVASASLAAAIGAMAAARTVGIEIPRELSFTAFHDAPIAGYTSPTLTTVAMPLEEVGRQAVEMLHRRLISQPGPIHVTVSEPAPVLIRRGSVGAPVA